MIKELALQVISELPDDVNMTGIIEALYIRMKVEQGLYDFENNNLISDDELKEEVSKW